MEITENTFVEMIIKKTIDQLIRDGYSNSIIYEVLKEETDKQLEVLRLEMY